MKKLLIFLSLGLCMPVYSIEKKVSSKKVKKDDGLKSDAIKGAITLAICLATRYYTNKVYNDTAEEIGTAIISDPRFAPYYSVANGIDVNAMPEDIRQQYETRSEELGTNGVLTMSKKIVIPAFISVGTGIAALVYSCKVIYKAIKRATSSNETDENIEIEDEELEEAQTA